MITIKLRARNVSNGRVVKVTYELLNEKSVPFETRVTSTKNFGHRLNKLKHFKWADEESKKVYRRL